MIRRRRLVLGIAGSFVALSGVALALRVQLHFCPPYREALAIVATDNEARRILGEPIVRDGPFGWGVVGGCTGTYLDLRIPVAGSKKSAWLDLHAQGDHFEVLNVVLWEGKEFSYSLLPEANPQRDESPTRPCGTGPWLKYACSARLSHMGLPSGRKVMPAPNS